jgi:hypothetical protein
MNTPGTTLNGVHLGVATRVITPEIGSDLCGFIARVAPMDGVHDDLLVKAMVWAEDASLTNAAALVTFDLIDLEPEMIASIRQQAESLCGISGDRIGITCTHTHGGPPTMPGRALGVADPAYLDRAAAIAAEAVATAAAAIEPVVFSWSVGHEATVGKNRRIKDGVIDPQVPTVRFQRVDGSVAALFVSYACHPVTLGPNNLKATGDYPGFTRRTLEAVYPGASAHFATGCCGQINNGHTSRDGDHGRGFVWRTFGEAERIGRAVAGAALQAAEQTSRFHVTTSITDVEITPVTVRTARSLIELPFMELPDDATLAQQVAEWEAELQGLKENPDAPGGELARLGVYLDWAKTVRAGGTPASATAEVMAIGVGEMTFVLLPGESFVEFGLDIKRQGGSDQIVTLAYANGRPGYIPHRSAYPAGGYEVDDAYRYYGYPACFTPEAGEMVVATALELVAQVRNDGATA